MVPLLKTSPNMWTTTCKLWLLSYHHIIRTPPTSSINSVGYPHYNLVPSRSLLMSPPCIPTSHMMKALWLVRNPLNSRETQDAPTSDLYHLVELILTRNAFTFNDDYYLHQHGTAMGTIMHHGTIICQLVHGEVGAGLPSTPGQAASCMVAIRYFS